MRRARPGRSAPRWHPAICSASMRRQMTNAIGIAGSLAGGLLEFARGDGGTVKRLHLGRASEAGVLAASLAAVRLRRAAHRASKASSAFCACSAPNSTRAI